MANLIIPTIFLSLLVFTIFLTIIDLRKKREKFKKPLITFIIPCLNSEKTIENCIKSLFLSYIKNKIDLIITDDGSKDNTLGLLKSLKKKYKFLLIENKKNLGKAKSINNASKKSNGEIICILDSDTVLNKKAVTESLRRLHDEKVGAVSCRYKIEKENVLSWMVGLEFNMLAITHSAYNVSTCLSLWGGCSFYKKKAFEQINGLRENMIVEDMDSALRLNENGWRVEQSFYPVLTYAPDTFKRWFKQKVRWSSGGMQSFLEHPKSFLKSPLSIIFILFYSLAGLLNFFELTTYTFLNISFYTSILLFALLSSPYFLLEVEKFSDLSNFFYVILFSLVYYPIFLIISLYGSIKGVFMYFELRRGGRAW